MNILYEPSRFVPHNQHLLNKLDELEHFIMRLKTSARSFKHEQFEDFLRELIRCHGHDIKNDYFVKIELIGKLSQLFESKKLAEHLKQSREDIYQFFHEGFSVQQKQEICLFFLIQYKQIFSDLQQANRLHIDQIFDVEKYSYLYHKFQNLPQFQLSVKEQMQLEQDYSDILIRQLANPASRFRLIHEDSFYLEKIVTNILLTKLKQFSPTFLNIYGK